jgi:hypothetical protein
MMGADWLQLIAALQALGLKVIQVNEATGRIVLQVPEIGER